MARHVVARAVEIPAGGSKAVTVAGREIAIFNLDGEYFALLNRCPHEGGPLCQGRRTALYESKRPGTFTVSRPGEIIRCPWHGWEFDIRTGRSYIDPERMRTRAFDVSVATGRDLAAGSYTAETFPVSLDQDYVVVEM